MNFLHPLGEHDIQFRDVRNMFRVFRMILAIPDPALVIVHFQTYMKRKLVTKNYTLLEYFIIAIGCNTFTHDSLRCCSSATVMACNIDTLCVSICNHFVNTRHTVR
jgi:hypothetical protein